MNKKGKPTKPNRTEGSEAGRTKQGRKDAGEEGKRRPAGKEREDAREGSRIRREKPHRSRRRARAALPVCRCERHLNNTYNMVERAKPHRAEAFVARRRSEDKPISHNTPYRRYDNRTIADTTRYPEGDQQSTDWTRRHRGLTKGMAASTPACYVFICTNLEHTRNTRPI